MDDPRDKAAFGQAGGEGGPTGPPASGHARESVPETEAHEPDVLDGEVTDAVVGDVEESADAAGAVVDADLTELEIAQRERAEYLELAQRTRADFENFRKRATAEAAAATERGKAGVATELIGVIDNLERALEAAEIDPVAVLSGDFSTDNPLAQGIGMTYRELTSSLARAGVETYGQVGETFDPNWHEALQALPVEGADSGSVTEVMQRGYRIGERVLRPARVTVAQ